MIKVNVAVLVEVIDARNEFNECMIYDVQHNEAFLLEDLDFLGLAVGGTATNLTSVHTACVETMVKEHFTQFPFGPPEINDGDEEETDCPA